MYIRGQFGNFVHTDHVLHFFVEHKKVNDDYQYHVVATLKGGSGSVRTDAYLSDWYKDSSEAQMILDQIWDALKAGDKFLDLK